VCSLMGVPGKTQEDRGFSMKALNFLKPNDQF
jgi:hypothetical protein